MITTKVRDQMHDIRRIRGRGRRGGWEKREREEEEEGGRKKVHILSVASTIGDTDLKGSIGINKARSI